MQSRDDARPTLGAVVPGFLERANGDDDLAQGEVALVRNDPVEKVEGIHTRSLDDDFVVLSGQTFGRNRGSRSLGFNVLVVAEEGEGDVAAGGDVQGESAVRVEDVRGVGFFVANGVAGEGFGSQMEEIAGVDIDGDGGDEGGESGSCDDDGSKEESKLDHF